MIARVTFFLQEHLGVHSDTSRATHHPRHHLLQELHLVPVL